MSATAGGHHAGELPLADVTVRMAVFARLFAERTQAPDPLYVDDPKTLVTILKERIPRTTHPLEDAPLFEAAAFVGEWLRVRTAAAWVVEGPYEPHLQVVAPSHAIIYLLPIVSILRVASTAGYDGLPELLEEVIEDVAHAPPITPIAELSVQPDFEQRRVVVWVKHHAGLKSGARAALWRRCQACSKIVEDTLALDEDAPWDELAANAAAQLATRPFRCACGGPPGEVSRFLMLRAAGDEPRLADIHLAGTHTRMACWSIAQDGNVRPLDATALAMPGVER